MAVTPAAAVNPPGTAISREAMLPVPTIVPRSYTLIVRSNSVIFRTSSHSLRSTSSLKAWVSRSMWGSYSCSSIVRISRSMWGSVRDVCVHPRAGREA